MINVQIPQSLSYEGNRESRSDNMENNIYFIELTLFKEDPVIHIKVKNNNTSRDHRMRMLFPTDIQSDSVYADGHFYIVPRSVHPEKDEGWEQKWVPTHHQHKFVSVSDKDKICTVLNKGLPEYEAIVNKENGTITLAITLLRSIEWLSRHDLATRHNNAGPSIYTPGAQCIGSHEFELGLILGKGDILSSGHYRIAEKYHAPLRVFSPYGFDSAYRRDDAIYFHGMGFGKSVQFEKKSELSEKYSLFKLEGDALTMTTVKKCEYDDSLIVRIVNMASSDEVGKLIFTKDLKSCEIVNMNEEKGQNEIKASIQLKSNTVDISIKAHVILTLKIQF
jgi:alpha-mannosidase